MSEPPIAAIATAPGRGGIGVVRVSGRGLAPIIEAVLGRSLVACNGGSEGRLARAVGGGLDRKTLLSLALYLAALACAPFVPIVSCLIYAAVAVLWIIPDRRIERALSGP